MYLRVEDEIRFLEANLAQVEAFIADDGYAFCREAWWEQRRSFRKRIAAQKRRKKRGEVYARAPRDPAAIETFALPEASW